MTKIVDIDETQEKWANLVALARSGTEVILAQSGTPLARIMPFDTIKKKRILGLHDGETWTSDDFDEPLPEEIWSGKI